MVHLVDILRSAKVEYPPPVIVSKVFVFNCKFYYLINLFYFDFTFLFIYFCFQKSDAFEVFVLFGS